MTDEKFQELQAEIDRWNVQFPGEDFDKFRRRHQEELIVKVAARKRIYLDMKYWIWLRTPGESPKPRATDHLLSLLRAGVASKRMFCPVSYPAFLELMKQFPTTRRLDQAVIMDELSIGVGLLNPFDIAELEYLSLISRYGKLKDKDLWIDPPWVPVGNMIVEKYPVHPEIPPHLMEECNKLILRGSWNRTMADHALSMAQMPRGPTSTAARVNQQRILNPRAGKTFARLYAEELNGGIEAMEEQIENALRSLAVLCDVNLGESERIAKTEMRMWVNVLRERVVRDLEGIALPSQRTRAALHAAIRMDDGRAYKPNDMEDISHSSVAAGYCDLFLTERSFAELLRRGSVRAVIPKQCKVVAEIEEAIAETESFLS